MTKQMDMAGRYKQLRHVGLSLNMQLTNTLSKSEIHEGGRKLGILQNDMLVLDNEDEIAVLMDFCLHDVRRNGTNAIERFLMQSPPPPDSDETLILHGKRAARYSLFMVEATEPGGGVRLVLCHGSRAVWIRRLGWNLDNHLFISAVPVAMSCYLTAPLAENVVCSFVDSLHYGVLQCFGNIAVSRSCLA